MKILFTLILLSLTGCINSSYLKTTTSLAKQASPALININKEYDNVNSINQLKQETILINNYSINGYHPGSISNFIDSNLQSRKNAINVLINYVNLLDDIASGKSNTIIEAETKILKQNIAKSSSTSTSTTAADLKTLNTNLTTALAGLDTITEYSIKIFASKNLPTITKNADPSIQKICNLIVNDLNILESQENSDYTIIIMNKKLFIDSNNLSAIEKRNEIENLYTLEFSQISAKKSIEQDKNDIILFAKNHHNLSTGVN